MGIYVGGDRCHLYCHGSHQGSTALFGLFFPCVLLCSDLALELITGAVQQQHQQPPHHPEPQPPPFSSPAGSPQSSGGLPHTGCLLTLLHDALALGEEPAAAAGLQALSASLAAELASASASASAAGEALMMTSGAEPHPPLLSAASLMRTRHPEDWERLPAALRDSVVAAAAHQLTIRGQKGTAATGSLVQQQHGRGMASRCEADPGVTVAALDILFSN